MTIQNRWHGARTATAAGTATGTDPTAATDAHRMRQPAVITAWVLQILLGLAIAGGGMLKLTGDPAMVEMFDDIGAGQWLRVVVGTCEVAGGVGLVIPRVRAMAALCLLVLLIGAAVTNVTVLDTSPLVALGCAAVALVIMVLRRHELPAPVKP